VTRILPADRDSIFEAAAVLRGGGLVAFPTETVYGLGAAAENGSAMRALFAAKGRPADHPVILHVAAAAQIEEFTADVSSTAHKLAAAFWPGPMTLVLRRTTRVSNLVTGGLDTVGIRVPAHPAAQALLKQFGGAVAAPSANRFGRVSCTRAEHVAEELGGRVDLILDGGESEVGLESTIIDVSSSTTAILRPGAVTAEQVSRVLGISINAGGSAAPRVSGSLPSHYAPRARVELVASHELATRAQELATNGLRVALLSPNTEQGSLPNVVNLSAPADEAALAHSLYDLLRRADAEHCDVIIASLPDARGLGQAIADRLRRAAGPRDEGS
jgi:L-threonylcarbamoyladenylate synthase